MKYLKLHAHLLFAVCLTLLFSCRNFQEKVNKKTSEEDTQLSVSRQVHLDFHTSEHIENIGVDFSKTEFQEALKLAKVNSVNVFAKCWHGWSYYETAIGNRHPHLTFDLLKAQIDACHEIGVKAPVYFAVGHAASDAIRHPEWQLRNRAGQVEARNTDFSASGNTPRPNGSWIYLAPVNNYLQHIEKQVEEICKKYEVDGFWFDGVYNHPVAFNPEILAEMRTKGLESTNDEAVFLYGTAKWQGLMERCLATIQKYHPQASVFFNGTTEINNEKQNLALRNFRFNTKNDLEDLPTTSWGWYDKFPLRSKLFHNENKPIVAMSGKFHEGWGEFGGFKHPDALRYEAASMIAFGAACCFGDQLHPSGKIDLETYKSIGAAYQYVEQIEAFGVGGKPFSNLGIWFTNHPTSDEGVANMLLETQTDFEVVNIDVPLSKYETIIIPSGAHCSKADSLLLTGFLNNGGKLLVVGEGALNASGNGFILPVGAQLVSKATTDIDYMQLSASETWVLSPFLCNSPALRTRLLNGSEILAKVYEPYFSRTYEKYCSHQNTPPKTVAAEHPAIVKHGNVLFFAHNIDRMYFENGARIHRDVFILMLRKLLTKQVLQVKMPSAGRVSLLHQPGSRRYVAHLLYASPIKRGRVHVIEDLVPLFDVSVALHVSQKITRVYTIPGNQDLKIDTRYGLIKVIVPKVEMHQAVVFEYE